MLGRKAEWQRQRGGPAKRKWQVEQEKDSNTDDSEDGEEECVSNDHEGTDRQKTEAPTDQAVPSQVQESDKMNLEKATSEKGSRSPSRGKNEDIEEGEEDEDEEAGATGQKRKRFAWMDSDDDLSDGEEDDGAGKPSGVVDNGGATDSKDENKDGDVGATLSSAIPEPQVAPTVAPAMTIPEAAVPMVAMALQQPRVVPWPSAIRPLLAAGGMRPSPRPPAVLPPGVQLPQLTPAHLGLMSRIGIARTINDLWELVEAHVDEFSPPHAAIALHRLANLMVGANNAVAANASTTDLKPDNHRSFAKLRDRLDELLGTAEGRATFLTADLALVAASLARVVQIPAKEGAISRIFADIADEAETRIATEPSSLMPSMLSDLAWGTAKSGNAPVRFLRTVADAAAPKLEEMTCQDLAHLASTFGEQAFSEADTILEGVFAQTKQRLEYQPPATNALFGVPATALTMPPPPLAVVPPAVPRPTALTGHSPGAPAWQITGQWRFSTAQLADIMQSVAPGHIGLFDPALFAATIRQLHPKLSELTSVQVRKLSNTFDLVKYEGDADFVQALKRYALRRM